MRVVINPAANVSRQAAEHYRLEVAPLHIVVDGATKDGREPISLDEIDGWIAKSKQFPHAVGTSASEFSAIFSRLARDDRDLVAVMSSRKLIHSHGAAVAAAKALHDRASTQSARVAVVDSLMTDVATGLLAFVAGEAAAARVPLDLTVQTLETMARRSACVWTVATLDNLVRSGRAAFLKAWLADALNMKPVIGFVDGDVKSIGRFSGSSDRVDELARFAVSAAGKAKKVWVGVAHGGVPEEAIRLEWHLRRLLPVEYIYRQPLSPGVYLYGGRGALLVAVLPVDGLPWTPSVPPDFSEKVDRPAVPGRPRTVP